MSDLNLYRRVPCTESDCDDPNTCRGTEIGVVPNYDTANGLLDAVLDSMFGADRQFVIDATVIVDAALEWECPKCGAVMAPWRVSCINDHHEEVDSE